MEPDEYGNFDLEGFSFHEIAPDDRCPQCGSYLGREEETDEDGFIAAPFTVNTYEPSPDGGMYKQFGGYLVDGHLFIPEDECDPYALFTHHVGLPILCKSCGYELLVEHQLDTTPQGLDTMVSLATTNVPIPEE